MTPNEDYLNPLARRVQPHQPELCAVGLVDHQWKRVSGISREGFMRCAKCKHVYHVKTLGSEQCPGCAMPLQAIRTWHRICQICGRGG